MTTSGGLALDPEVVAAMDASLASVADEAVAAITAEVPDYGRAMTGEMGSTIGLAVQTALRAFLRLAAQSRDADPGTPLHPALEGAYALGRGEARSGRTMDALLAAYRVGARVCWRELSARAVGAGLPAPTVAQFAEMVFAYIDQLSAASVAGHTDELATSGRVREHYLERLGVELLGGAAPDVLLAAAERADWAPPASLTAVLLPSVRARGVAALLDPRTLTLSGELAGLDPSLAVLLSPDPRDHVLHALQGRPAVVGPARPWTEAASSVRRAVRARALAGPQDGTVDSDEHLAALVLGADPEALADLRARVLAPLAGLRAGTADRLVETLRAWLLLQGRRDEVATHLVVHPQTVRYRMGQLRELFGDRLTDPARVLELLVAVAPVADTPGPDDATP